MSIVCVCVCVCVCTLSLLLIINVITFTIETLENKEKGKEAFQRIEEGG